MISQWSFMYQIFVRYWHFLKTVLTARPGIIWIRIYWIFSKISEKLGVESSKHRVKPSKLRVKSGITQQARRLSQAFDGLDIKASPRLGPRSAFRTFKTICFDLLQQATTLSCPARHKALLARPWALLPGLGPCLVPVFAGFCHFKNITLPKPNADLSRLACQQGQQTLPYFGASG